MRGFLVTILVIAAACSAPPPDRPPAAASAGSGAAGRSAAARTPAGVSWQRLPASPLARTEVTAAAAGDRIVVAGGFAAGGRPVAAVVVYDTVNGRWEQGPDLPLAVHHAMAASDGDTVFLLGGYTSADFSQPGDHAFALRGGAWTPLPPLPEPRAAGGAAVIDGQLHVAGGVGPTGLATRMLVFDIDDQRWSVRPGPPTAREHLGVAAVDGRLYVMGGRTGGLDTNLATAEVFDSATGTWSRLDAMPTARGGVAAAATTTGLVVVAGGEHAGGTFAAVEAFDVRRAGGASGARAERRGRWRRLAPLPTPRHGVGVAAVGAVVHVLEGGPRPGLAFSSANEALDLGGRAAD